MYKMWLFDSLRFFNLYSRVASENPMCSGSLCARTRTSEQAITFL